MAIAQMSMSGEKAMRQTRASVKSIARFILFVELRLCHSLFLLYEVVGCEINH